MADKRTVIKRDGQVKLIKEMVRKGQAILEDGSQSRNPPKEILALVKNIRSKKSSIDELSENILNTVEEENMEEEMNRSTDLDVMIDTELEILECYLTDLDLGKEQSERGRRDADSIYSPSYSGRSSSREPVERRQKRAQVRLPTFELKKFGGDPTLWPEFFDTYSVAIHENTELTDVERFTYLKGYLSGEAARCIEGLTLTAANYNEAVKLLKDRFGNKKLIISRHMVALLEVEKVNSSAMVKELRALYDKIMVNIRALKAYEITPEQFGPMLSPVILKKLPADIKLEVSRRLKNQDWMIDELLDILRGEIETQETCASSQVQESKRSHSDQRFSRKDTRFTTEALHVGTRVLKCVFCEGGHYADKCSVVTDINARLEIVRNHKLCYKCLGAQHSARKCRSTMKCFACKSGRHHTAICQSDNTAVSSQNQNNHKELQRSGGNQNEMTTRTSLIAVNQNPVFLQTIRVTVADVEENKRFKVNVIFDGGSQKTYISQKLAENLNLKAMGTQEMKINAFGDTKGKLITVQEFNFCLNGKQGDRYYLKGFAVPVICAPLNNFRVDLGKMAFEEVNLRNFLPEEEEIDGEIDILIGADYYWSLVTEDITRLEENLVLIRSKLGYMLSGPMNIVDQKQVTSHATNCVHVMKISSALDNGEAISVKNLENKDLDKQVEKFWNLDSVGILQDEKSVYDINQQRIEFVNGRYQVELPFKEGHPMLEDNYSHCVKRLSSLKQKLEKTPSLLENYDEIIRKQISEGIVELVDDNETTNEIGSVTYMPHRAVVKEGKSTTKVRIVYDCSAKAGEWSLNECLYKGTCLTPLIFDSLLRFRLHDVALVADIESAYLQISVVPEQRDFLRFLWFKNVTDDDYTIQKLRFARVLFGAAPSQYLLNAVIKKHVENYQKTDPEFEKMVKSGFYVDDLSTSVETSKEAIDFYHKCKIRFAGAGFNIRKWRSNDPPLKQTFAEKEVKFENVENGKVLGISWDDEGDFLIVRLEEFIRDESAVGGVTKRQLLKVMAGFYDPPGWIQPIIVTLKILFQEACKAKIGWDDKVPADLNEKWKKAIAEIKSLSEIKIPRCYCYTEISNPVTKILLHGFSDASLSAYGACVYLKFVKCNGETKVSLVASKSRVAPVKNLQTIPRLELMGNVILSRLILSILKAFQNEIKIEEYFCHTDSQISLSWVRATQKEFKPFVQNRVNEIRRNIKPENWYYCRTNENPADLLTRTDNSAGVSSDLWWKGPEFLQTGDFCAFETISPGEDGIIDFQKELKAEKCANMFVSMNENASMDNLININKYSDLMKLLRVTSYVLRFVQNIKKRLKKLDGRIQHTQFPTADEMREAHVWWVKANQVHLTTNAEYKQVEMQLNCKVDESGVIRSYGRMKNANVPDNTKAPIMLSKEHRLSVLIVLHCHLKVMHRGIKQTLNEMRANYWITKGRTFVKKIISPCVLCRKLNGRPYVYPGHSDLPELRYDDRFPFASTGCDYLGPLFVLPVYGNDNSQLYKAHVVLYTCTATRAVILDVVNSNNTKNFIQSLRRFISRRGCPALMISDNGSSFIADETREFTANHLIEWKFNVPYSPWMGGIWERLVSCVKKCLKRTIGVRQINFIELQTLISEIETILNNRPICNDYDDDIDEVLTPNHLLFGRRLEMTNLQKIDNVDDNAINLSKREKHLEKMRDHFWTVWRKEYVTSLREGHKCTKSKPEIVNENDIVMIYDKRQPRHMWKLGRITELIRSKDGAVRAAKVKCGASGNILSRPLNKLYPIEFRKPKTDFEKTPVETSSNDQQEHDASVSNENVGDPSGNIENEVVGSKRTRRNAAMIGERKRKHANNSS